MAKREVEHPYREGEILAGKFRVEKVIGTGGMGVVLSCMHLSLEQMVAVKLLLPDAAKKADVRGRFAREARAAVKLQSEHVARVIDVGALEDGSPYMVMEYLQGRDLSEIIDKDGAFDPPEAVDYVLQACEAVAEAHALGIVHRDLKPSNLFLAKRSDRSRTIKVLDFGISKVAGADDAVDASLTRTTDVLGSPMYMSPEQLRSSRTVDARADIWSLGVILFELLTLEPPFAGATLAEICGSILHEPPKKLRTVRPGMPKGLEDAILRCVEKAPSARFQTVADLAEAITRFGSEAAALSRSQIRRWGPASSGPDVLDQDLVSTRAARPPRPEELAETRAVGAATFAEAKATNTAWGDRNRPTGSRSILPWALVGIVAIGAGGVGAWQLGVLKPSQIGLGRFDKRQAATAAADAVAAAPPSAAPVVAPVPATASAARCAVGRARRERGPVGVGFRDTSGDVRSGAPLVGRSARARRCSRFDHEARQTGRQSGGDRDPGRARSPARRTPRAACT